MRVSRGEQVRVRGLVQGVGFRPRVWRLAREMDLLGDVRNDGGGVLIRVWAEAALVDDFCRRLLGECPALGRIDSLERSSIQGVPEAGGFRILSSVATAVQTGIVPDAATCPACRAEILDPANRRYRYPFTNCTHCGPRLSNLRAVPYDRANTSMSAFPMCALCAEEYRNPADRRFHAQPNACWECGPRVWLEDAGGARRPPSEFGALDAVAAASGLLAQGAIVAIKGIGGFHLACDACDEEVVARLRRRKGRERKPFALMARDPEVIGRYCRLGAREAELLRGPEAPILLLESEGHERVASGIAPGQSTLGFMLPYSPLHHLLLKDWDRPLVMTSGNPGGAPQCIDNADARQSMGSLAEYFLLHDREILNRVDDSVLRFAAQAPRLVRRARGYAPAPIELPEGLHGAPPLLALGGELKNSICLYARGQAILSQHLGDLAEARTAAEYEHTIDLYRALFQHDPRILVVDPHPDYRSAQFGRAWALHEGLELVEVQHHFAHIASVLADNAWPADAGRVVGIALDGLGYGDDGTLWGGELLLADYRGYVRAGHLRPVPLPGGAKAVLEPWRDAYAQLATHIGWEQVERCYPRLELVRDLAARPLAVLATMIERGINSPMTSSCGRLFDALAATLGLCREQVTYEGQAAIELEALAAPALQSGSPGYRFAILTEEAKVVLDPKPMWYQVLDDLARGTAKATIAASFHNGLATAVADAAIALARDHGIDTAALSGGVFQNKILLEAVSERLRAAGVQVLGHKRVPANDGGLSLGQAVAAAACHRGNDGEDAVRP